MSNLFLHYLFNPCGWHFCAVVNFSIVSAEREDGNTNDRTRSPSVFGDGILGLPSAVGGEMTRDHALASLIDLIGLPLSPGAPLHLVLFA